VSKQPNLDFYRRRAKDLLALARSGDDSALARFTRHHPDFEGGSSFSEIALHQAQLVIARENGFSSWPRLKAYIGALERTREQRPPEMLQSIVRAEDADALAGFLESHADAVELRVEPLGFTALHIATSIGWQAGVELLLEAGADIDARDRSTELTSLHIAVGYGFPALALLLLERGADPHATDRSGVTTLRKAAYAGDRGMISALAERGVPIDIFAAVALDDEQRVREIAAESRAALADRMCSHRNVTIGPLHLAAFHNRARMVDVLLELGADIRATDEQGRTAVDLALHGGKRAAYERLQAHGAKAEPALLELVGSPERSERIARLHRALVHGEADAVIAELETDPTLVNQRLPDVWGTGGTYGAAPLHWAAMFGHLELARLLIDRGADLALRDLTYHGTPLGWANEYRRREMAAFLEAHGAKP